jgi:hypothetical protein
MFFEKLKAMGWTEVVTKQEYAKGNWKIDFDTSHWMIVSTNTNPRVFDVPAPGYYEAAWTVNLIEHLCQMEDERQRLRTVLAGIRDNPASGQEPRSAAAEALQQCYHRWLVNLDIPEGQMGRLDCPICGQTETGEAGHKPQPGR